ncbi:MAG: O-antigen ligase family protein [Candidatus Xenobiia bacterium LiM19]
MDKNVRCTLTRNDFLYAVPILMISALLLVPLVFSTHFNNPFQLVKASLFYILLLLALPFCVYVYSAVPRPPLRVNGIIISIALYALVHIISTIHSFYRDVCFEKLIDLLSMMVFFFIMMRFVVKNHFIICLRVIAVATFLTSVYALLQHAGIDFPSITWSDPVMVRTRSIGSFGNPTFLAGYLVVAMPLVLYLFFTDTPDTLKKCVKPESLHVVFKVVFYISTWSLAFSALLLSLTRGAWLAFAVSHTFILVFGFRKVLLKYWQKVVMILLVMSLCTGVCILQKAIWPGHTVVGRLMTLTDKKEIHTDRLFLWGIGIQIFKDNMLTGTGPGTFPYVFMKYRAMEPLDNRGRVALPEACHNQYIETALSTGIPGLFFYLLIAGFVFHTAFKVIRGQDIPGLAAVLMMSSGIAYLTHNFFLYSTISTDLIWWFIAAWFSSLSQPADEEKESPSRLHPFAGIATALVSLLILILFFINTRVAVANYYVNEGKKYESDRKWELSLNAFNNAVIYNPHYYKYHLYRGKMLENFSRQFSTVPPPLINEVVRSYQNAITLNPFDPYSLADMGRFLGYLSDNGDTSRTAEAIRFYEKAIAIDNYNPMFCGDLGNVYAGAGNTDKALYYYRRSLEVYPSSALVYVNMATLLLRRNDQEGARKYLMNALEIDPDYKMARSMLQRLEHSDKGKNKKES